MLQVVQQVNSFLSTFSHRGKQKILQFFRGHLFPIGELLANRDAVFDTFIIPIDLAVFVKTNVGNFRATTNRTFGKRVSHFSVFDIV